MSTKLQGDMVQDPLTDADREFLLRFFPQGVVAFDIEATGISPLVDRVVELSAYKITPNGVEIFDALINPQVEMTPEIVAIHGITNEMVKDAPEARAVLPKFIDFIGELPLVAHNARFDVGFFLFSTHQLELETGKNEVYCTLKFARQALPSLSSYKLGALSDHFKITHSRAHRALDDAIACLKVMRIGLENIENSESKIFKEARLYQLSDFARNLTFDLPLHLRVLRKKIKFSHIVLMKYAGGSLKNKWRPIRPVSLLPMPEGNILYAHCLHSNIYKSFALTKIKEVKETSEEEVSKILAELKTAKK